MIVTMKDSRESRLKVSLYAGLGGTTHLVTMKDSRESRLKEDKKSHLQQ